MDNQTDPSQHVAVPFEELSAQALKGVIESFVLREGTDYGEENFSLEEKVAQVLTQLRKGDVRIVFNVKEETFDIIRASR